MYDHEHSTRWDPSRPGNVTTRNPNRRHPTWR